MTPLRQSAASLPRIRAAIRAECAKHGIDDDTRRGLMQRLAGVTSSTQLDLRGALAVLDHLRGAAGKHGRARRNDEWAFVFSTTPARQKYLRKIYKLAERVGPLMTPPCALAPKYYIEGIARQMAGCDTVLEFCDESRLTQIIAALDVFLRRHAPKAKGKYDV
jgi:hypothetical protein